MKLIIHGDKVDTTEEYIEMSMALPDEMISAWEPYAGDFVFAKHGFSDHDYRNESDNGVLGIITKVQEDTFSIEPCGKGAVAWYSIEHSTPLWKQDQLQDMLDLKPYSFGKSYKMNIGRTENKWMMYCEDGPVHCSFSQISESLEQLWLTFIMYKKYGKAWNGKEWII